MYFYYEKCLRLCTARKPIFVFVFERPVKTETQFVRAEQIAPASVCDSLENEFPVQFRPTFKLKYHVSC